MKKMRVIGLALLLTILFIPVHAQVKFGIKGGVNISKVHFSEDLLKPSNLTGFQIGPMAEIMAPYTGLGMDAAILYTQKGMEYKFESFNADYLSIPLNVKLKFGLPIVKGFVTAGPAFDFRVGGDKVWEIPGNISGKIKTKNFATAFNIGAGVEAVKHLQVGINYGFALTDSYESESIDAGTGKNRTWSITAAILF